MQDDDPEFWAEWLRRTKEWAIKKGLPPDVVENAKYLDDVHQRLRRWKQFRKIEEADIIRISNGLPSIRNARMHFLNESGNALHKSKRTHSGKIG